MPQSEGVSDVGDVGVVVSGLSSMSAGGGILLKERWVGRGREPGGARKGSAVVSVGAGVVLALDCVLGRAGATASPGPASGSWRFAALSLPGVIASAAGRLAIKVRGLRVELLYLGGRDVFSASRSGGGESSTI